MPSDALSFMAWQSDCGAFWKESNVGTMPPTDRVAPPTWVYSTASWGLLGHASTDGARHCEWGCPGAATESVHKNQLHFEVLRDDTAP